MKKKRRLKKKYKFILIIILFFVCISFITKYVNYVNVNSNDSNHTNYKKEYSYVGNVDFNGYNVDEEVNNLIIDYMNNYYATLKDLKVYDSKDLFSNLEAYYIDYSAMRVLTESRKSQLNDMTMKNCKYDIKYTSYEKDDDIKLSFLEDGSFNFNFMKDIDSKSYNVKNYFVIEKEDGEYKIKSIDKVQDFYVMITNKYSHTSDYQNELDNIVDKYINIFNEQRDENLNYYNDYKNKDNEPKKDCDYQIDREKAYNYAIKYANKRNNEWNKFDDLGGNCQNYASQVIYAGGVPMDIYGDYQWKNYGYDLNVYNERKGRSNSWTSVSFFYDYIKNNDGFGICALDIKNIYYALPGDVIHVGNGEYIHAVVPIKIYNSEYDEVIINSNTNDLENYPLSGYSYPDKRLIKVFGYNK